MDGIKIFTLSVLRSVDIRIKLRENLKEISVSAAALKPLFAAQLILIQKQPVVCPAQILHGLGKPDHPYGIPVIINRFAVKLHKSAMSTAA